MKSLLQQEKALLATVSSTAVASGTTTAISAGTLGKPTLTLSQKAALAAKQKAAAMSLAMKPAQQIAMNSFMLYMSGSQLNVFSISITSMAILSPLTAMFQLDSTFAGLQSASAGTVDLQLPKLIFLALNFAWLCIGLYKMSSMRLLPTTSADWTFKIQWKEMMEKSSIPPDTMIL